MMRYQSSNDTLTLFFDVTAFPYHERMVGSYEQFLNDYSGRNKIKEALSSADRPEVVARANDNSLYRIESYYEEGISRTGKGKLLDNETLQPIGDALDINCNAVSDWYIKPKNAGENINPGGEGKDYSAEVKTILDAKSPEELEEFIDKYQKQEFIERWWVSNLKEGIKLLKAIKANDFEKLQPIRVLNLICRDIFDINNYSGSDPDRAMKVRQAIKDRFEQLADEARKELEKRAGFKFYNSESELGKEFDPSKHTVGEIARRPWREGDPPLTHGDQTILEVPAMGFSINGKLDTPAQVILAEKPSNDETEQASSLEVEFGDGKKLEIKPGSKFVLDGHSIEVTDLQSKENDTFVLIHKVDGSVGTTEKTATKQEWQTLFEGAYRERRLEI
jgi:hypothetical protein